MPFDAAFPEQKIKHSCVIMLVHISGLCSFLEVKMLRIDKRYLWNFVLNGENFDLNHPKLKILEMSEDF